MKRKYVEGGYSSITSRNIRQKTINGEDKKDKKDKEDKETTAALFKELKEVKEMLLHKNIDDIGEDKPSWFETKISPFKDALSSAASLPIFSINDKTGENRLSSKAEIKFTDFLNRKFGDICGVNYEHGWETLKNGQVVHTWKMFINNTENVEIGNFSELSLYPGVAHILFNYGERRDYKNSKDKIGRMVPGIVVEIIQVSSTSKASRLSAQYDKIQFDFKKKNIDFWDDAEDENCINIKKYISDNVQIDGNMSHHKDGPTTRVFEAHVVGKVTYSQLSRIEMSSHTLSCFLITDVKEKRIQLRVINCEFI